MEGWKRTYWSVWTANLITSVGMMSFLPFFPTLVEQLGETNRDEIALWAGVLYGAAPLSAALMGPIWGSLGDRYGRRLMVLRSMAAITVFVGAMAFATSTWQVLVLRILQGVFSGYIAPSMTLVSVVAPVSEQGRISGSLQTASAAGAIVGPVIGGALALVMPLRYVFIGVALLSLVSATLIMLWAHEDPLHRRRDHGETSFVHLLQGSWTDFTELMRNQTLRASLAIVFWIQFAMGTTNPILELHVRDLLHSDEHTRSLATSLLFSGMAAVNLLAMPLWGKYGDRHGHAALLVTVALWSGLALIAQGLAPIFALLLLARLVFGAVMAGSSPLSFGLAAREASIDRRGAAFGVVFGVRTMAIAASAMLGGWLSRYVGVQGLFVAGGVIVVMTSWWMRTVAQRRANSSV
ncbi:MAG: MFS transporter [Planctomycetes bacterium]|nr:MFS transporter [Planctomycetota bacterium]